MKKQTKQIIGITLAATVLTFVAVAQTAKEVSVKAMPPSVVKTVPPAGATDVDPALNELTFTFSKPMTDGSWSACQISDETFPKPGDGKMHYLPDKRTCVMPVKLEPGKTYVIWLNRGQYQNFRDAQRNSSVPYLLVFETRK
jgi:RNA polymerase sigma-70 factor (ECF subfamily)